ncbi:MAG TPA: DNA polymerase III subunit delta [Gemmatimonadaceae bacterium]|jgi:DNA polymerase-3 subunit delta|nr:DNA polymerase III subunit delta [Gemmatimonadaceae bacterium]HMH84952.1 DNA polymerase III subunit delta [Gemmatimonadaceae bacterium]
MSASSLKTLRDAIKRRSFDGAYFIWGEDDYQKDDAIRQLIEAALDPGARDFNLDTRRSGEIDAETLGVLLSTPPMMAERRVIVLRDVGALKKDARKVLDQYLKSPAPDLLLLMTGAAGSKADTVLSASSTSLQFDPLTGDRIPRWITHRVTSELGLTITEPAIELLQAAVGSDLHQLAGELDKLASYIEGHSQEIGEEAVAAVVGVRRGETQADLLDAVADRNAARALGLISHVLAQTKTTGVSIVMALATQMLAISWGRSRLDEGLPRARLAQEYFDLLKATGAFTGRPWGSAAAVWARAADRWSRESLDRALDSLLEADIALKESRVSSEEQLLATVVLSLCAADDKSAAA